MRERGSAALRTRASSGRILEAQPAREIVSGWNVQAGLGKRSRSSSFQGTRTFGFRPTETLRLSWRVRRAITSSPQTVPGLVFKRCTTSDAPIRSLFLPPAESLASALVFENP